MKVILFVFPLFILWFLSCTDKRDDSIITFHLSKSDYIESINVQGTVQAVVNFPVMPPRSMYGQMTVVRLAQDGAFVKKGDTICILSSAAVESMYEQMLTSIETLEAELKKTEADNRLNLALLEAQLATSEAQLKLTSLDTLQMKFATAVNRKLLELEMKKALIKKQKTERKLVATKNIGESDIRQKNARIMQEKMRAQSFADQINAMTIIAQRDGIIMRTEAPTVMIMSTMGSGTFGGQIKEGSVLFLNTPVLQFPDLSRMEVSANVGEADFKRIEKGQKVVITVNAANKLVTTGKVNRKSLASSTSQRYSPSKVKSYEVKIDVDSCHSVMKPGLSADCEILLKEASDTLFVPTMAIFEKDSIKLVYVKEKKKFIPVKVETGSSGSSYTIITGGLKGDELISLSEPPASRIISGKVSTDTIKKP